jgi:hypothetical protein
MQIAGINVIQWHPLHASAFVIGSFRFKKHIRNPEHRCVRPETQVNHVRVDYPNHFCWDCRFFLRFPQSSRDGFLSKFERAAGNTPGPTMVRPLCTQLKQDAEWWVT